MKLESIVSSFLDLEMHWPHSWCQYQNCAHEILSPADDGVEHLEVELKLHGKFSPEKDVLIG